MDLIIHQMVELQEVHIAHRDLIVEALAGAAVVQPALALGIEAGQLQRPEISLSVAPSKMGVATFQPRVLAA